MKLSTKAAIYSTIVFPGAGYFVVKKYVHGVIALLFAFGSLAVVFIEAYHKAQIIAEKIVLGLLPINITVIREQLLIIPDVYGPNVVSAATGLIVLIWLIGILDSYRIGRAIEA